MSLPNRDNPYSFDDFVRRRDGFDYYADDEFLQRLLRHHAGDGFASIDERVRAFSRRVSFAWRELTEINSLPENRPWLMHYDGYGHRVDRIVRPRETEILEREIFGSALFAADTPPWERFASQLLLHQNGEFGVMCPLTCTEGLLALVGEYLEDAHPVVRQAWTHCKEGRDGEFGTGAQFLTEIQGGSDVPGNLVEAEPAGDHYRLHGVKFFCSACHTDYSIVTAKITGSEQVSTFLVPAWLPGDKARERRNGHVIRRLKRKLGTIELATGEIEYQGAVAYLVGPRDKGVANVVAHVLTLSRMNVSIANAACNLRVTREAAMYAGFRRVFDRPVADYPLAAGQLAALEHTTRRTAAALFRIRAELLAGGDRLTAGLPADDDIGIRRAKFRLRILIMLQKLATTRDTIDAVHSAMSILAGHGVMECFSALPRLLRDAMINEQWEGPRNLLLNQVHADLGRVAEWYPPAQVVTDLIGRDDPAQGRELAGLANSALFDAAPSPASIAGARAWDAFAHALFHAYQDDALAQLERA